MSKRPPIGLITFDTELFWGLFFLPQFADREADMPSVRSALEHALGVLDARGLPATFAVVGRLFAAKGDVGEGPFHPDLPADWKVRAEAGRLAIPGAWWGRDVVDQILRSPGDHEIGGHGHVHVDFDRLTEAAASRDVRATIEAAKTMGVDIRSWVFPRNRVAHERVLARCGIRTYREAPPSRPRALRFADQFLGRARAGVPRRTAEGLIALPAGAPIIPGDGVRRLLSWKARRRLVQNGLEDAVRTGGVFHLWTHPHNFVRNSDLMRRVLEDAADEFVRARDREGLEVLTMSAAAARFSEGAS